MSRSILVIDTLEACIDCPCHFAYEDGIVPSYKVGYNVCIEEILKSDGEGDWGG